MKFYIVDAFTEQLFGGNPAGVVILDEGCGFPPDETMRKTAAELRYSETAFIEKTDDGAFQIRYFTPVAEVELCGHATIASFKALLDAGLVSCGRGYTARTQAGDLAVGLERGSIMMEMGKPALFDFIQERKALEELYTVMGLSFEPVFARGHGGQTAHLFPMIISTGLPDIILPVKDRNTLDSIAPDFPAMSALSKKYRVTGVHAFTPDCLSGDITARCRNFAPLYGIDEEAATGTASGALTYYLSECGLLAGEKECTCTFIQGEAMGRPSKIRTCIDRQSGGPVIRVGGNAAILARGAIDLNCFL